MAKSYNSSLPKVISKANKDISTIIENDIQNESLILKNLVDEVLAANMEVKKKNNQRITETRRKLQALDIEIDELNKSIDLVDRETVVEQLNQMIETENNIFKAKKEVRFFENVELPKHLENINIIYNQLDHSIEQISEIEKPYKHALEESNDQFFQKYIEITTTILHLLKAQNIDKKTRINDAHNDFKELYDTITETEKTFFDYTRTQINDFINLQNSSETFFSTEDNDDEITEKLINEHKLEMDQLEELLLSTEKLFIEKQEKLIADYNQFEDTIKRELQGKNEQALNKERLQLEKKEEELKNIKLLMIDAEKKQDFVKVQKLMKQYEKIEKTKDASITTETDKVFLQKTKPTKEKTLKLLKQNEVKKATEINKINMNIEFEKINYEESKILHKIKSDYQGLQSDLILNKEKINLLHKYTLEQENTVKTLYDLKLKLRLSEIEIMKQNELEDNTISEQFRNLLSSLKEVEHKRKDLLLSNSSNHAKIKIEQHYHVQKTILDLKLNKELSDIDKRILKKQNESIIKIEKQKEKANSEIIYQESLIKIAKKERELQLVKVNSLYENERGLAEEQIDRIELGVQVNSTFVKTTLENQLLFAQQQIKCAQSEYDIRIESIALTKDQELAYAYKKIDSYKQKYEYEKGKIIKDRDDRLEDLKFKLLLFTDKKDNESLTLQMKQIYDKYQILINEIDTLQQNDEEIIRYQKVIDATEDRAEQAIMEAEALKEQTTSAFQALYDTTKEKFETIKDTNRTDSTQGIMPLLNSSAVSSADARLKQAVKDADELFEERILGPQKIINEQKQRLLEITENKEITDFIQTQKDLKQQRINEHQAQITSLDEERQTSLDSLKNKEVLPDELQNELLTVSNMTVHRTNEEIKQDYNTVIYREKEYHTNELAKFKQYKKELVETETLTLKTINKAHKATIQAYKKYMRSASRGLNQQKRELTRNNKKVLKKAQTDALNSFISPI